MPDRSLSPHLRPFGRTPIPKWKQSTPQEQSIPSLGQGYTTTKTNAWIIAQILLLFSYFIIYIFPHTESAHTMTFTIPSSILKSTQKWTIQASFCWPSYSTPCWAYLIYNLIYFLSQLVAFIITNILKQFNWSEISTRPISIQIHYVSQWQTL